MSGQPKKLRMEEGKADTATRSPPKKSRTTQTIPKKKKLKSEAEKVKEKAAKLRLGKAEITPEEVSRRLKKKAKLQAGKKKTRTEKTAASDESKRTSTAEGEVHWFSRWKQRQEIRKSYYAAAQSGGMAAQAAGSGKAASGSASAARSGVEQVADKGRSAVSAAVNGIANFAKGNAHALVVVAFFFCSCCWSCRRFHPVLFCFPALRMFPGRPSTPQRTGTSGAQSRTIRNWKKSWTKKSSAPRRTTPDTTSISITLTPLNTTRGS